MTISEYINELPKDIPPEFQCALLNTIEIWSNGAASGYMLHAADSIGLSQKTKETLLKAMESAYERLDTKDANLYYQHWN